MNYPQMSMQQTETLFELHTKLDEAFAEWKGAQEAQKEAKAAYEAAQLNVAAFIRRVKNRGGVQDELPFDKPAEPPADAPMIEVPTGPPVEDDSWRSESLQALVVLGLPDKIRELLEKADIFTLGQLADYTATDKKVTDIKGVGPTKATQLDEALERYWKERRDQLAAKAEQEPTTDPGVIGLDFGTPEDDGLGDVDGGEEREQGPPEGEQA